MSDYYPYLFTAGSTPFRVMTGAERFGHVQTTSNAWTEVVRLSLTEYSDLSASLTVCISAIRGTGNNDGYLAVQELGVKRVAGGNADIIGVLPTPKISADASLTGAAFRVTESGTDVVVEVKAPNSSVMDWCGQICVNHMFGRAA